MNTDILSTTFNELMVEVPSGEIELRDDRTKQKWPVNIKPFLLAKFPITQDIYFNITNETPSIFKGDKRPVETVTWQEAVIFCNLLSEKSGLKSCYILSEQNVEISFDQTANGFRLPTDFTICWATFGNGVRTYTTRKYMVHIGFSEVAVGVTKNVV
ncbi:Sulfatase-modifying factor enzyme 1 [bacterium A37T11]|nr:Sulfatase-modifying factor enzyme 1 [bacterium A37T11]